MSAINSLSTRLGLQHPIIQAPMAGVATPALAAAVSNAGALGSLGLGSSNAVQGRAMIEATQALTSRAINVNLFCHAPAQHDAAREAAWLAYLAPQFAALGGTPPDSLSEIYKSFLVDDDAFRMLLALRPAVVSFHFGLPSEDKIAALRAAGITTLATATSLDEAWRIERAGVDALVAQGIEAGGHRGMFDPALPDERHSMPVLVRQLVLKTNLPVIAAGGIMDGKGIRAALALGASAAQLGTAFILCPESSADAGYRATLQGPAAHSTRLTAALSGRPARGMLNTLVSLGEAPDSPQPAAYPLAYDAAKRLNALAQARGDQGYAAHWAGQGAPLARALPAAELVALLADELASA